MLKRVEIENFRSCQKVVLDDLGPMTVLVGRNAVGKSNILRAISWLAETATSSAPPTIPDQFGPTRISMRVVLGEDTYDYSFSSGGGFLLTAAGPDDGIVETLGHRRIGSTQSSTFSRHREEIRLNDGRTISVGATGPCMPAIVSVLPPDSEPVRLVRPLLRDIETIRYYPMPLGPDTVSNGLTAVRPHDVDGWLARDRGAGAIGAGVLMRLLDMKLARKDQFDEVQQLLGQDGLGLIDHVYVGPIELGPKARAPEESWYSIAFQPTLQSSENLPRMFGFDDLSSGTQRLVAIVTSLIYDHSAVMLLEHPEDGIHRALLRKLIGVLQAYSDESQLIIATHSPVVLDAVEPSAVRLVTMEDGQTKVRALTSEEVRVAAKYLEEEGSLAEFLGIVADD
jgi:predicted ATPase